MDQLSILLMSYAVNISSAAIYDLIKIYFSNKTEAGIDDLQNELVSLIKVKNANVIAEKVISFLAENGDIMIDGSKIYSKDSIRYKSSKRAKFTIGNNTESTTQKTALFIEKGLVEGQGGAEIEQDKDGNFIFKT